MTVPFSGVVGSGIVSQDPVIVQFYYGELGQYWLGIQTEMDQDGYQQNGEDDSDRHAQQR